MPVTLVSAADGIGSATTIAGTKPDLGPEALSGSVQNDRRQFSKSEREMPYRRAVEEIARGLCMLSRTILSFSSPSSVDVGRFRQLPAVQLEYCTYRCP